MSNIPEPKNYGSMSQRIKNSTSRFWCISVSFSGKDANKIISSLTEPWKPIRPKKKNNSPPGRPEENAVNQSSQEQNHSAPSPSQCVGQTSPEPAPPPAPPPPAAVPERKARPKV